MTLPKGLAGSGNYRPGNLARRTAVLADLLVIVATVLLSAVVLWTKQTPDALLRVDSFAGAVAEVLFWSAPAFAIYLLFARRRSTVLICGLLIATLTVSQWSSSATDRHSTASIGPGGLGWLLLPIIEAVVITITRGPARSESAPAVAAGDFGQQGPSGWSAVARLPRAARDRVRRDRLEWREMKQSKTARRRRD